MKALPNWSRHEIAPVLPTMRFAQVPRQIPNAVHNSSHNVLVCNQAVILWAYSRQLMTRAPRIAAGEFSAAKMGTLLPFTPIPMPRRRRQRRSCSHV